MSVYGCAHGSAGAHWGHRIRSLGARVTSSHELPCMCAGNLWCNLRDLNELLCIRAIRNESLKGICVYGDNFACGWIMMLNLEDSFHSSRRVWLIFGSWSHSGENPEFPGQRAYPYSNKQRMSASRIVKLSPLTRVEFSLNVDRSYIVSGKSLMWGVCKSEFPYALRSECLQLKLFSIFFPMSDNFFKPSVGFSSLLGESKLERLWKHYLCCLNAMPRAGKSLFGEV